jgi:hypothetical protein
MSMKPYVLGMVVDVKVEMRVREEAGEGGGVKTVLDRYVSLSYPWALLPFKPMVDGSFKKESLRTLEALKAYVEGLGKE